MEKAYSLYFVAFLCESDDKSDVITIDRSLGKSEVAALHNQYLAREGESDASAGLLCGEERNEDFASYIGWNRFAIVAYADGVVTETDINIVGTSLDSVLYDVYEDLSKQVLVGAKGC